MLCFEYLRNYKTLSSNAKNLLALCITINQNVRGFSGGTKN